MPSAPLWPSGLVLGTSRWWKRSIQNEDSAEESRSQWQTVVVSRYLQWAYEGILPSGNQRDAQLYLVKVVK